MTVMVSKTYAAHRSAGADPEAAREAAEEVGELVVEVRVTSWKLNLLLGLQLLTLGLLLRLSL